jgi:hypothetical protein
MEPQCRPLAANKRFSKADPWGGLFRAATTFAEASTGAEKSVGHGGSPTGSRLWLAWCDAPTPKMTSVPEGRLKALRPFPVADSSETSPWVGYPELLRNLRRTYALKLLTQVEGGDKVRGYAPREEKRQTRRNKKSRATSGSALEWRVGLKISCPRAKSQVRLLISYPTTLHPPRLPTVPLFLPAIIFFKGLR